MTKNISDNVSQKVIAILTSIKATYSLTWQKIKTYFDEEISKGAYIEVSSLKDHNQWRKIFDLNSPDGKTYSLEWWNEMEIIIVEVEQKLIKLSKGGMEKISPDKIKSIKDAIDKKLNLAKSRIRYGVFPCQDTILPLFFRQSYNRNLNVEFVSFDNWRDGLEAFKSQSIDVALHNFPTVVAFNAILDSESPLFFWPFFSFNGYGIFVRKSAIKRISAKYGRKVDYFEDLKEKEKRELLETSKILVEKRTDFEWVLNEYCRKFKCDIDKVERNVIDMNTNRAKSHFLENTDVDVYCTNSIHIHDLAKYEDDFELVGEGDDITYHENFNGLVCTVEYLNNHVDEVAELIATWFNDIADFRQDIIKIKRQKGKRIKTTNENFMLPALTKFLNDNTESEISLEDLASIFERNTFKDHPTTVFLDFFNRVLQQSTKLVQNYVEIAEITLKDEENLSSEVLHQIILSIKNKMTQLT